MSLVIKSAAIHFLSKKVDTGEIVLTPGPASLEVTPKIESFIDSLHKTYNAKSNKAYGGFTQTPVVDSSDRFDVVLRKYQADNSTFDAFSTASVKLLINEIEKYDMVETGYLVISHYEYLGGRFMLISIVPVSDHYSVDGKLNISANQHLDTSRITLAARIDLFEFEQNAESNRYVSFIKGRAGRKVSDFFLDFLSCEEGINAKEQTNTLVNAVEDYISVKNLDAEEKQKTRVEVLNYCKEQKASNEDVSVKELSKSLNTEDASKDFYTFCQEQQYPIEDSFPHEQSIVNKVTKYSGYGDGITVNFERKHFGNDVVYNPTNESLTIYKVPPNLKEQLISLLQQND